MFFCRIFMWTSAFVLAVSSASWLAIAAEEGDVGQFKTPTIVVADERWEWVQLIPQAQTTVVGQMVKEINRRLNQSTPPTPREKLLNVHDARNGWFVPWRHLAARHLNGLNSSGVNDNLVSWRQVWEAWALKWDVNQDQKITADDRVPTVDQMYEVAQRFRNDQRKELPGPDGTKVEITAEDLNGKLWPPKRFEHIFALGASATTPTKPNGKSVGAGNPVAPDGVSHVRAPSTTGAGSPRGRLPIPKFPQWRGNGPNSISKKAAHVGEAIEESRRKLSQRSKDNETKAAPNDAERP